MPGDMLRIEEETARFTFAEDHLLPVKIRVIGVGGAGGNAINRMVYSKIKGVQLIAANTDIQSLRASMAPIKLQIGAKVTGGHGCGGIPELGRQAAFEDTERLLDLLAGAHMVFVTGGFGGGTCTGAGPVIAGLAADAGALTVAVVITPFSFLGKKRRMYAEEGIRDLKGVVDTLITIPNDSLLSVLGEDALLEDCFRLADDVLCQAVQGISDIITRPGIVNVDFAHVRTLMHGKGAALVGTGVAQGQNRAVEAAQRAVSNPLLETPMDGAKAVLMNITGSRRSFKLREAEAAAGIIEEIVCPEDMIFGAVYDDSMGDQMKVTVIATGFRQREGEAAQYEHLPGCDNAVLLNPAVKPEKASDLRLPSADENLDVSTFRRWYAR
jgi:cell division protein FtsZ